MFHSETEIYLASLLDIVLFMFYLSLVNLFYGGFLGKVEDVNKVQTLLFSATLPSWVKDVSILNIIIVTKLVLNMLIN